ncbi:stress-activated protein kinase signaling cascade [Taxawa tesnikishii (nom. ined.)]|nr:stress-activated protein kinase signaling cascade [Dothideales sp. JES 119]
MPVPPAPAYRGGPGVNKGLQDTVTVEACTPWKDFTQLGILTQGAERSFVCMPKAGPPVMYMFKRLDRSVGRSLLQDLQDFKHHNIVEIRFAFADDADIYIGMDYLRCTLEEVIHVHLPLTEMHIRLLAKSIFGAIQHPDIATAIVYESTKYEWSVSADFAWKADWENCSKPGIDDLPNTDLEDLGLVLLDCMDGRLRSGTTTAKQVRKQRDQNKVYGLKTAERWSGCKQLVDLLEDLFNIHNVKRSPHQKLLKPVRTSTYHTA